MGERGTRRHGAAGVGCGKALGEESGEKAMAPSQKIFRFILSLDFGLYNLPLHHCVSKKWAGDFCMTALA